MPPYYAQAPLGQAPVPPAPDPGAMPGSGVTLYGSPMYTVWRVAGLAAGAALAYHGYKRNNSIPWALAWAVFGGMMWPVGLGIAYAQGFAKPSRMRSNRSRRRRSRSR